MPKYAILSQEQRADGNILFKAVFQCDDGHEETQQYVGDSEKVLVAACEHMNKEWMAYIESMKSLNENVLTFKEV